MKNSNFEISKFVFKKIRGMFRESFILIKKEKAYFLAPIIVALILVALVVYHAGPSVVIAFIYAGV